MPSLQNNVAGAIFILAIQTSESADGIGKRLQNLEQFYVEDQG